MSAIIENPRTIQSRIKDKTQRRYMRLIERDSAHVQAFVLKTPLIRLPWLSTDSRNVWAKLECNQLTSSFKIRGAYNAIRKLRKTRHIYTASGGNHGLATAYVARELGRRSTIYLPEDTPQARIKRLMSYGARVEVAGADLFEATTRARAHAERAGGAFISPFTHEDVITGQASIALEVMDELVQPFANVILPLGGGGLVAGAATGFKAFSPQTRIIAVHPQCFGRDFSRDGAGAFSCSVCSTLADGLAVQHEAGDREFGQRVLRLIDRTIMVTEADMAAAVVALFQHEAVLAEAAGAIVLAPLMRDPHASDIQGDTLIIVTGGNISAAAASRCFADPSAPDDEEQDDSAASHWHHLAQA